MKKINLLSLFVLIFVGTTLTSCKKRKNTQEFLETTCLIAKEVREGGVLVYTKGGNSSKPAYSKFKLEANLPNKSVQITEIDGTITKGVWTFANEILSITGLNPALTDNASGTTTRTTASYAVSGYSAKAKELKLTAKDINLKSGTSVVEYTMVPCE